MFKQKNKKKRAKYNAEQFNWYPCICNSSFKTPQLEGVSKQYTEMGLALVNSFSWWDASRLGCLEKLLYKNSVVFFPVKCGVNDSSQLFFGVFFHKWNLYLWLCSFLWSVNWMIHLNCFFFWVFFHNWNFYLWHRLRSSLTPPPCRGFAPQPRSGCRTPQACIKSIKVKTSQWPGRVDLESWSFLLNFYSLNWNNRASQAQGHSS